MTRDEFLAQMLEKGKVTQVQIDKIKAKDAAKALYKKDKAKMTKADMQAILETLVN
jgi:hypothetical protein